MITRLSWWLRSTRRPRSTNRRTTNAVTFAFSPTTFGVPSASAIRSAAAPPEIGGEGHRGPDGVGVQRLHSGPGPPGRRVRGGDEAGVPGPPEGRCGHPQPLGRLARVVLGSSQEITSRSFAGSGGQNMTER